MEIKVLGPGCPKCRKLYEEACKAVEEAGAEASVEKIEDIQAIVGYGVMMTPGLVIDGELKCSGKVPSACEIAKLLG